MVTLGIDLAAQPKTTAACAVEWQATGARVAQLSLRMTDELLEELIAQADKVGVDVPFGWPDDFVRAIVAHTRRSEWPAIDTRRLRFRRTDLYVQSETGKWPLSVSTDRIGITAFRAARLLHAFDVERTGQGLFVEVYPAAALRRWDLTPAISELTRRTEHWLDIAPEHYALLSSSRDSFDALLAALIARASARDLCDPVPRADVESAAREGWIALPDSQSLDRLV